MASISKQDYTTLQTASTIIEPNVQLANEMFVKDNIFIQMTVKAYNPCNKGIFRSGENKVRFNIEAIGPRKYTIIMSTLSKQNEIYDLNYIANMPLSSIDKFIKVDYDKKIVTLPITCNDGKTTTLSLYPCTDYSDAVLCTPLYNVDDIKSWFSRARAIILKKTTISGGKFNKNMNKKHHKRSHSKINKIRKTKVKRNNKQHSKTQKKHNYTKKRRM